MAFSHALDAHGRRVRIPAHWLTHPVLSVGFAPETTPEPVAPMLRARKPKPVDPAPETPAAEPVTGEPIEAPATGDTREGE